MSLGAWERFNSPDFSEVSHLSGKSKEGLPIVFPITLFQGPKKWTAALHFHDFLSVPEALKPYVPSFEYHLVDLSGMSDDQIKGSLF